MYKSQGVRRNIRVKFGNFSVILTSSKAITCAIKKFKKNLSTNQSFAEILSVYHLFMQVNVCFGSSHQSKIKMIKNEQVSRADPGEWNG